MRRIQGLVLGWLNDLLAARGQMFPWVPVFLAVGIGAYFALPWEPGWSLLAAAITAAALIGAALRGPEVLQMPAAALAVVAVGFLLAVFRAHVVAAPVLPFRYYGPVEGRIIDIDRSFSDQPRLTLDMVVLDDVSPGKSPTRVRISLHDVSNGFVPEPGMVIQLTAHLSPPDGPTEPGGFDFQRLAWFSGLGAVGYSRTPVLVLDHPQGGWALAAFRLRMTLSKAMQNGMSGQPGAFGAALMTGDRSGVDQATNNALRASNLSHIISISGLHMGLLSGFVFALFRYGLALIPPLALRLNTKKLAALIALIAATFYMFLAGPDVATRRSYIMAAVILLAVLADRRAISLRSVAISALICLGIEPESLVEPGFQMSFGATVALIVGFGHWAKVQKRLPKLLQPAVLAVVSSVIAGTATAPIAAVHFNRIAEYGLLANLLAVPVMGFLVMPAGVLAALLGPIGLAGPPLWVLNFGCMLILAIADWVAGMKGAVAMVPTPPAMVLPMMGAAGVALLLAQRLWLRGISGAALALTLGLWAMADRPSVLISGDGGLVGMMTPDGRVLSKEKGGGFVAKNWLENDGDRADQATAALRAGFSGSAGARLGQIAGRPLKVFAGKKAAELAAGSCTDHSIVVMSTPWAGEAGGDCLIFDPVKLSQTGALAIYVVDGATKVVSARSAAGDRLWNRVRLRPATPDPQSKTAAAAAP